MQSPQVRDDTFHFRFFLLLFFNLVCDSRCLLVFRAPSVGMVLPVFRRACPGRNHNWSSTGEGDNSLPDLPLDAPTAFGFRMLSFLFLSINNENGSTPTT